MQISPVLIEALKRLDPSAPARPEWYIDRQSGGAIKIVALAQAGRKVRALVHGNVGVGKSTELMVAARALEATHTVLHVRVGDGQLPDAFDDAVRLRIAAWARDDASSSLHVTALKTVRRDVFGNELRSEQTGLDMLMSREVWAQSFNAVLTEFTHLCTKPPILLVDGLDLRPTGELTELLSARSPLVRQMLPSAIYIMPNSVIGTLPESKRDTRFEPIEHIAAVRVVNPDLSENREGIDLLCEGLEFRIGDLSLIQGQSQVLRRIAFLSGGIPRDAIRILQAAVLAALRSGRVNAQHVQDGVRELRQDLEQGLAPGEVETLLQVRKTGRHQGAAHLIAQNAILPYEGPEHRYWLPHPLLWPMLDAAELGV